MTDTPINSIPEAKITGFSRENEEFFLVVETAGGTPHRVSFDKEHSQLLVRVIQDHMALTESLSEYPRDVSRLTLSVSHDNDEVYLQLHTVDGFSHAYAFHQAEEPLQTLRALLEQLKKGSPPSGTYQQAT